MAAGWRTAAGRRQSATVDEFYTIDSLLALQFGTFGTALKHLAMPAFVLGFISLAPVTRMVRSSMLEVLTQDYVRTAQARGWPRRWSSLAMR